MDKQTFILKALTREEKELLCFSRPLGYHTRLQQYFEYPEAFAEWTTLPKSVIGLSTTKAFRHYLRRFVRTFQPEILPTSKHLWLHMEKNGRFSVRLGKNGEEISKLVGSDSLVFQYLCFLHIRRFWCSLRKHCHFPAPIPPVAICDFSNQLDETVDYDALLLRALEAASQVVVL